MTSVDAGAAPAHLSSRSKIHPMGSWRMPTTEALTPSGRKWVRSSSSGSQWCRGVQCGNGDRRGRVIARLAHEAAETLLAAQSARKRHGDRRGDYPGGLRHTSLSKQVVLTQHDSLSDSPSPSSAFLLQLLQLLLLVQLLLLLLLILLLLLPLIFAIIPVILPSSCSPPFPSPPRHDHKQQDPGMHQHRSLHHALPFLVFPSRSPPPPHPSPPHYYGYLVARGVPGQSVDSCEHHNRAAESKTRHPELTPSKMLAAAGPGRAFSAIQEEAGLTDSRVALRIGSVLRLLGNSGAIVLLLLLLVGEQMHE